MAPALRGALLAGTVLSGVAAALPTLALADGGGGGSMTAAPGGAGGSGFTGQPGQPGSGDSGGGGGSAGGGAGGIADGGGNGGAGGANGNGAGAAALDNQSPLAGGDGNPGDIGILGAGGGGGAGGYGAIVTGSGASSNASSIKGGNGGNGGEAQELVTEGSGGGDGGIGVQFTASGASLTNAASGTVSGGNGGNGSSAYYDAGGRGGLGGAGVAGTGISIVNNGAISGGQGGVGGEGAYVLGGSGGAGGGGVIGSNLIVTNAGTISGGGGGSGSQNLAQNYGSNGGTGGDGISGSNLAIVNTGTISGGMGGSGTFGLDASGTGGDSGRGVNLTGGSNTLTNSGTITGGAANGGAAGAGVVTSGGTTINNSGTISGGLVAGTAYAAAIQFGGTGNRLNLLTGSTLVGDIQLTAGAGATIAAQNSGLALSNAVALGSGSLVTFNTSTANLSASGVISGGGSVTVAGVGTLVLSGSNTYTGGTTLSGGALSIASDVNLGAVSGGLTFNGGTLRNTAAFTTNRAITLADNGTFQTDADLTVSGDISGDGLFTKTGAGTLTMSGNNTYTGGTLLLGGTLVTQGGHAIGVNSSVIVVGGSTLRLLDSERIATLSSDETDFGTVDLAGGNLTVSVNSARTTAFFYGDVVGTGGLIKDGTYKQVLAGNNSYTGGTTILAGTLQLGDATHTSTIIGNVTNSATLEIVNADTTGLTTITNNGQLNFRNATSAGTAILTTTAGGQTAFAGDSTAGDARLVTEAGGVVDLSASTGPNGDHRLTAGSIEGAGLYRLGANVFSVGGNDLSTVVDGVISDGGASGGSGASLTKTGAGTLTLNGQSTYTGATTVNSGKLVIGDDSHAAASLASAVTVNSGGTLGGIGTVGGLTVASGGAVAPGNSIGTLNVAGNVTFAAGSIYQVEANAAGQSDRIVATGTATLGGGSVLALAQNGTYAPQTTYTILTANGGVTGTFGDVASSLVFLTPILGYDADNVFLTFNRSSTTFPDVAATPNQRAVSNALQQSPLTSPLVIAVLNQSVAGARQAFDALSGEVHASAQTAMLDDSRYLRDAVLGRLRQASFGGDAGPLAALTAGGPQLAAMEEMSASSALAYAGASKSTFPMKAPPAVPARFPETAFWAQGVGAWGRLDGDGSAAGMRRDLAGFFSGVDHRFAPGWIAGIAGGYTSSTVRVGDRSSSTDIETAHLAGYVGATYGALSLRGGAAASFSTLDTSRSIIFPNFVDSVRARYDATAAQVFGEVGYGLTLGQVALEPFAGLAWVHLDTGSFSETGGSGIAALLGSSTKEDVGYSTLGARIATSFILTNGMSLTPRASVAWQYALGDVTPTAALAFQSTGANFTVAGTPLARNAALVEAGLDLRVTPQASVGISYVGQLSDRVQDHSVKGSFTWKF